jgi:cyclophilin family peptidyl-prolyl cis-trans isomerase
MKTNFLKNNRVLVLCIYALAFMLMTWSFNSRAEETTTTTTKKITKKVAAKKTTEEKASTVIISTTKGDITVKLNPEKAPISTANFLKYVDERFYDDTIFHRVISDFMIQGGGFKADMKEKETHAPIDNEAKNGLSNKRGTIAMARTNVVNSATAQFFINTVDNQRLDYKSDANYGYAVFGEVTSGMDVVDKIREVRTTTKAGNDDVPVENIIIKSIRKGTK